MDSAATFDHIVIGGGVVGLATAMTLARRGERVVVLEAADRLAAGQTGHNSGVIHSGLYYRPGSLKARNCVDGRRALLAFCREHDIPHRVCGKVVVATECGELPRLEELERRGRENGLEGLTRLDADGIRAHEPHAAGIAGLFVPETGVVDFELVCRTYADILQEHGGEIRLGARVVAVHPRPDALTVETTAGEAPGRRLVNCAGLYSDRVARMCGVEPDTRIIPFRGEYVALAPERRHLVRSLVYPVPDPDLPFLGVHLTRGLDGEVEAGPNAVLAFAREGYTWGDVSARDMWETLTWPGFWRMAARHGAAGLAEMRRSLGRRVLARALRRLIPELRAEDLRPAGAGVRAQAVDRDGRLADDFRLLESERCLHVLNAPSPAATASLAIAESLADRLT